MNDIHLLSGAYALDALDDLERARFKDHLAQCPDCTEEVASLREAAAFLAEETLMTPPPGLRTAVLTRVSQVRPLPPLAVRRRPKHRFPLLLAAAVAIIAGVGAVAWSPWTNDAAPSDAERVLQASDAQRAVVDLGESGRATVVRSVAEDKAVIVTEEMVAPPEGMVFQVWFQTPEDDMVPAGVMEPVPDQTLVLDGSAADAVGAGITVEPEGGSPAPTSEPIALFDLT
ncbi:anti-sigma factor [Nocardioides gilvus]|uniref:anti-sigma factor n=1 Tax=Nocardioides gilvus TaxID=1735589 RepID=UPI000D7456EB|nr:anti-sigma factor [Nocardioides gilvus]